MEERRGSRFPGQGQASWRVDFECQAQLMDFVPDDQLPYLNLRSAFGTEVTDSYKSKSPHGVRAFSSSENIPF
jgi:hypothetical protein